MIINNNVINDSSRCSNDCSVVFKNDYYNKYRNMYRMHLI